MDTNKMFIDMAQRAREFAEMCDRVANESNAVKEDPEAWRERNRQRQAAGVKFEKRWYDDWGRGKWDFTAKKEDYREVPQPAKEEDQIAHHLKYSEVYQSIPATPLGASEQKDLDAYHAKERALPKPAKLTARIARCGIHHGYIKTQDWEFYGTPEEYRAECGKYGYAVVSEIKEKDCKNL